MKGPYVDLVLEADAVRLRAWQPADAKWYVEARDDLIYQFTTEKQTLTVEETVVAINAANISNGAICMAITDQASDELLGNLYIDPAQVNQTGEVGYWLARQARGRGIATTAVKLLSAWALAHLSLKHLWLKVMAENRASCNVAERVGFREVGRQEADGVQWVIYEFKQDDLSNP
ncbi:MAG: N-acetyltransferase [Caldilinea sp. CFX5]|nr:N-acetyltransferase [Caldilinea sp. CFX5]